MIESLLDYSNEKVRDSCTLYLRVLRRLFLMENIKISAKSHYE